MNLTGFLRRFLRRHISIAAIVSASALPLVLANSLAYAGDWSFQGSARERVDFFDNYRLLSDSDGYVLLSSTSLFGDLYYTTHDSRFDMIANIVANGYAGSGRGNLQNNIFPSLSTTYHKDGKRTSFDLGGSYSYQYIPAIEDFDVNNDIITTDSSSKHTMKANFGVTQKVDRQNSVSFSSAIAKTIFTGDGADNLFINNAITWNRQMTRRTDGSLTFGFDYLTRDDDEETERFVYRTRAGLTTRLTKRLTGTIGAGVNLVNTEKTDLAAIGTPRNSSNKLGYSADLGLNYALKTLTIGFSTNYGLQQGTLGDLQNRLSTSLTVSKAINDRSSVTVGVSAQAIESVDNTSKSNITYGFSFSPSYSYVLARNWNLLAGYRLTIKDRSDGTAIANNVFVSVSHNFGLKP